jgi:hypothetical protein
MTEAERELLFFIAHRLASQMVITIDDANKMRELMDAVGREMAAAAFHDER